MRFRLALSLAFLLPLLSTGCHNSASAHDRDASMDQPIAETYTQASAADAAQHELSPSDLATTHQEKGVGIGLEIDGRTFRAGQNIPMLIVYKDISAARSVSSTDCRGFSLSIEAVDQGTTNIAPLEPCLAANSTAQNNVALKKGNLRFLHTSLFAARQEFAKPGKYLIRATWQSYIPRSGAFQQTDVYARAHSNVIPIVVTR